MYLKIIFISLFNLKYKINEHTLHSYILQCAWNFRIMKFVIKYRWYESCFNFVHMYISTIHIFNKKASWKSLLIVNSLKCECIRALMLLFLVSMGLKLLPNQQTQCNLPWAHLISAWLAGFCSVQLCTTLFALRYGSICKTTCLFVRHFQLLSIRTSSKKLRHKALSFGREVVIRLKEYVKYI